MKSLREFIENPEELSFADSPEFVGSTVPTKTDDVAVTKTIITQLMKDNSGIGFNANLKLKNDNTPYRSKILTVDFSSIITKNRYDLDLLKLAFLRSFKIKSDEFTPYIVKGKTEAEDKNYLILSNGLQRLLAIAPEIFKNIINPNDTRSLGIRGHNENKAARNGITRKQEMYQALSIYSLYMDKGTKLNWVFDAPYTVPPEEMDYNEDAYNKVGKAFSEYFKDNLPAVNCITGQIDTNGIGKKIAECYSGKVKDKDGNVFNIPGINDKRGKNLNSFLPADIYLYNNSILKQLDTVNGAIALTKFLNNNIGKTIFPISLKLNTEVDKKCIMTLLNNSSTFNSTRKIEITGGLSSIRTTCNSQSITYQIPITDTTNNVKRQYLILLQIRLFTSTSAGIETKYSSSTNLNTTDISISEHDIKAFKNDTSELNTSSAHGKSWEAFDYFCKQLKTKNAMFLDDNLYDTKTEAERLFAKNPAMYNTVYNNSIDDVVMAKFNGWINILTHLSHMNISVEEAIIYNIMCGKRENYGELVQFPPHYLIS